MRTREMDRLNDALDELSKRIPGCFGALQMASDPAGAILQVVEEIDRLREVNEALRIQLVDMRSEMRNAIRDFHGKSVLFPTRFLLFAGPLEVEVSP